MFPALPIAPLVLLGLYGILGVYGAQPSSQALGEEDGPAWPVIRVLMAAGFVWSASLITDLSITAQLLLWLGFVLLDTVGRAIGGRHIRKLDDVERWVLVGEGSTTERLKAYKPLRARAAIVCTVTPDDDDSKPADRAAALEIVDRYHANRVVIASRHADDEGLLDVVRAFKSTGVPVSLLPRPLDLLDAPAVTPSQVGGVPLIDVETLAARQSVPYAGPDRRRDRKTKVSVVVPAMNEARNIGHVLAQLPRDLHEVILVDGNSKDETVDAARHAYPDIRVFTQNGRGKGDALRTGFAAVTGNVVVMLDADGSADPAEIPRFVEALEAGADFAKGSRFLPGGGSADITPLRKARQRLPQRHRQRPPRHPLHRPLLRLQRLLGAMPALHLTRRAGVRGRDPDQPPDRLLRDEDHRGAELRGEPDLGAEQPEHDPRRLPGPRHDPRGEPPAAHDRPRRRATPSPSRSRRGRRPSRRPSGTPSAQPGGGGGIGDCAIPPKRLGR